MKIGLLAVIPYVFFAASALAETQTLEQALAFTYQNNPSLLAARAKLRATDEQVSQAVSNWRPSIDAEADVGKTKQTIGGDNFYTGSNTLTPRDASVNITQPVFRGFRTTGSIDSAKAAVMAGRANLESEEEQTLLDAAKAYLDVLQAQDILEISRSSEQDLKLQLGATQDRVKAGDLSKTDIDQAQSRFKAATVSRLQAENELANKRRTFARIIGFLPETLVEPELVVDRPRTEDEAIELALNNNPDVLAAVFNQDAANADITVAKGSLLPEVDLVGSAVRNVDQSVYIPQQQDTYAVMAKLTIPLYRSGADYSKTRAAMQTLTERRMELDEARNKAKESASNAWQTLQMARAVIDADKDAVDATNKALTGVRQESKAGTRSTIDVLNEQVELFNTKTSMVKAAHDEKLAVLQLRQAIGTLTASALHLPATLYDPTQNYDKVRREWIGFDHVN